MCAAAVRGAGGGAGGDACSAAAWASGCDASAGLGAGLAVSRDRVGSLGSGHRALLASGPLLQGGEQINKRGVWIHCVGAPPATAADASRREEARLVFDIMSLRGDPEGSAAWEQLRAPHDTIPHGQYYPGGDEACRYVKSWRILCPKDKVEDLDRLVDMERRSSSLIQLRWRLWQDVKDSEACGLLMAYYKQNKGAETDSLLIDDDCSSAVNRSITGGLDTFPLLDAEEYDMIFEQLALKNILSTIDGVQSQVHSLQDRLSKAHLGEEKLAFSEENTQVRMARKRQSTQKHSFSYKTYRYTKPQKRKNLNILLKDDDGPAFATRPALTDRETNCQMEDAKGNTEEKSGELNHSGDRGITVDLLLGVHNSLPNGHMSDPCKENIDDILIDNQAANGGCQQFEKVKHLPPQTSSKGQSSSAPVEVKNTSAPLKVDNTSALVVKQGTFPEKSPIKKQGHKSKKKKGRGSVSMTKKQSKERSKTHAPKQKTETTPSAAKTAESTPSSPTEPETRHAGKKGKSGNKTAAAKKRKSDNSSSAAKQEIGESSPAAKKRKTENSSAAAKKQETENSSAAAKQQETENSSAAAKKQETESAPSKVMVEKAVLVAVNSRRSQRVRKPKVY
ncbi:hypothetical protein ACP70R_031530 [Stipagrostis hirtigluma subsp. patula]